MPEIPVLLDASERVLLACRLAEQDHGDRALRMSSAVDPCILPLAAVVGPGLPRPLADRVALRALGRLADELRPALKQRPQWTDPRGDSLVPLVAVRLDGAGVRVLGQAAARLVHPRRSREGALGAALESLGDRAAPSADDCHPAALGCLLAALVPVADQAAADLHAWAGDAGDRLALDAAGAAAHREVCARVLDRIRRTRDAG